MRQGPALSHTHPHHVLIAPGDYRCGGCGPDLWRDVTKDWPTNLSKEYRIIRLPPCYKVTFAAQPLSLLKLKCA